jgi:hypothetical protein
MSLVASFILLPRAALSGLRYMVTQEEYFDYLDQVGRKVTTDFVKSSWVRTFLLWFEEEYHGDLMESSHGELAALLSKESKCDHLILTKAHKDAFFKKLDPADLSVDKLRAYYAKVNGDDDGYYAGRGMIHCAQVFRESLRMIDDDSVVFVLIE